mgnify:CR=1 FL=1
MKKRIAASLLAAATVLALAAGCSSSANRSGASTAMKSAAEPSVGTVAGAGEKGGAPDQAADGGGNTAETAAGTGQKAVAAVERKIVKSASLEMETTGYEKAAAKIEALVGEYGGYIESSSVGGRGAGDSARMRTAQYTARVPAEKLDAFLDAAAGAGSVTRRDISGKDVTQSYVDTEARLKSLQTEHERLLDLMARAEKVEDLLNIENRLTEVQTQIEQMTAELKNMDSLVGFSSAQITLREVEAVRPARPANLWGQMGRMLYDSAAALVRVLRGILLAAVAALPFAAAAAAVLALVLLIRRRARRGKRLPPAEEKPDRPDKK